MEEDKYTLAEDNPETQKYASKNRYVPSTDKEDDNHTTAENIDVREANKDTVGERRRG